MALHQNTHCQARHPHQGNCPPEHLIIIRLIALHRIHSRQKIRIIKQPRWPPGTIIQHIKKNIIVRHSLTVVQRLACIPLQLIDACQALKIRPTTNELHPTWLEREMAWWHGITLQTQCLTLHASLNWHQCPSICNEHVNQFPHCVILEVVHWPAFEQSFHFSASLTTLQTLNA